MFNTAFRMRLFGTNPLSPSLQRVPPLLSALLGQRLSELVAELLIPLLQLRSGIEHGPHVVETGHSRGDDGDPLVSKRSQSLAYGVVLRGITVLQDGKLDDWDIGLWIDEEHGDEDAMVPAYICT